MHVIGKHYVFFHMDAGRTTWRQRPRLSITLSFPFFMLLDFFILTKDRGFKLKLKIKQQKLLFFPNCSYVIFNFFLRRNFESPCFTGRMITVFFSLSHKVIVDRCGMGNLKIKCVCTGLVLVQKLCVFMCKSLPALLQ